MTSDLPELDRRLTALREASAGERPPASTDYAIEQAIRRAATRNRGSRWIPRGADRWIALPLALAASIAMIAFVVRSPPSVAPASDRRNDIAMASARNAFIPLVSAAEIGRTSDAMLVPTRVPRTSLAELGWPIDPTRAADDVDAELLVRGDGAVLAVRVIH
jgi:hypothetical protein